MSQKLLILLCALAFGLGVAMWNTEPPGKMPAAEKVLVKNFAFTSLDGVDHTLSDFRGKVVFVNSWFTRCPPCLKEMPELLKLAQRHPDDMVFIAISADRERARIQRYLDSLPEDVHALTGLDNVYFVHDEGFILSRTMLEIRGFPETLIIGPDGHRIYKIEGVIDWLGPEVEKIFSDQAAPNIEGTTHTHENGK